MARYKEPNCVSIDPDDRVCGVRMRALGERHPSFGPNYQPGMWVFQCPRCDAVRALDSTNIDRYAERV